MQDLVQNLGGDRLDDHQLAVGTAILESLNASFSLDLDLDYILGGRAGGRDLSVTVGEGTWGSQVLKIDLWPSGEGDARICIEVDLGCILVVWQTGEDVRLSRLPLEEPSCIDRLAALLTGYEIAFCLDD